jgi:site-specific DNA recombinase
MQRTAIYLRISADPDGTQTSTERQREDCRKYADLHNLEVVDTFEDVDISAYKRKARRPQFERMLAAVRDGAVDVVLAWKLDRLARRQRDFVRLDEQLEESGGHIIAVADGLNTSQPTGRLVAEILTSVARQESANISTRTARAHEMVAKQGRPLTGGTRAFGYSRDRRTIISEEAELIREAMDRVMMGESLRGITVDWETRGIRSPAGKVITSTPLRRLLTSGLISGQRDHRGVLSPGTWPAIITGEETARLRAVLRDPNRRTNRNPRSYLLSGGLLRCGLCGSVLISKPKARLVRRYVCRKEPGGNGCGKLARRAEPLEELVADLVFVALEDVDISQYARSEGDDDVFDDIRRDEESLVALSHDFYVDGAITRPEFFHARDVVKERLEHNQARLGKRQGRGVLTQALAAGATLRAQWGERPLEWRRMVVSALIDYIEVMPAVRYSKKFDPTLIRPVWKA